MPPLKHKHAKGTDMGVPPHVGWGLHLPVTLNPPGNANPKALTPTLLQVKEVPTAADNKDVLHAEEQPLEEEKPSFHDNKAEMKVELRVMVRLQGED